MLQEGFTKISNSQTVKLKKIFLISRLFTHLKYLARSIKQTVQPVLRVRTDILPEDKQIKYLKSGPAGKTKKFQHRYTNYFQKKDLSAGCKSIYILSLTAIRLYLETEQKQF